MLALASGGLNFLASSSTLSVEEGKSKQVGFSKQIKHLPTIDHCTDMLKAYKNFIPHAKHYASKTFTTQIESLTAD